MKTLASAVKNGAFARIRAGAAAMTMAVTLAGTMFFVLGTAAPALASTSGCISGGSLGGGQYLLAVQGSYYYKLIMQTDGNLVEYELGADGLWHPLWDSQTGGNPGAHLAVQGGDGNLVIYSSTGHPLWAAFSFLPGQPGANYPNDKLCLQTDGNVVLYSTSGAAVWATNTITAADHRTNNPTNPFQVGQCTWGADIMFHNWNIYGDYIDWSGDAWTWAANARSKGWTVGTAARAGSIAVYQKYAYGALGYGHVAWVLDVYPSQGKVLIKEANYTYHLVPPYFDTRLVSATDTSANHYTGQPNIQYIYENPGIAG
jgi:surface antigen